MKSLRIATAALLLGGGLSVAAPAPAACAAEGPHAALVVDTERPGGQYRYCVALDDEEVSGLHLIELAHEQHGLDYRFGYGGNAVCVLAGVGYESDECLKEGPEFWGYWRGDGSGGWNWSSSGANATVVSDGDVEGWSWGTGNDGSSHPQPPRTPFGSVCEEDEPGDQERGKKKGSGAEVEDMSSAPGTSGASGGIKSAAIKNKAAKKKKKKKKGRDEAARKKRDKEAKTNDYRVSMNERHNPTEEPPAGVASEPTSDESGPPPAGLVAVGAAAVFVAGGVLIRRRRQT